MIRAGPVCASPCSAKLTGLSPLPVTALPKQRGLMRAVGLIFAAFLFAHPAWAINKCTAKDGSTVFQDTPCTGKGVVVTVRPASGDARPVAPSASGVAPVTEAQRIEAQVSASQRDRRARELQERLIPNATKAVESQKALCEARTRQLDAEKDKYALNMYGMTRRAAITSEMAAHATTCETKGRELREALAGLRDECKALGCK